MSCQSQTTGGRRSRKMRGGNGYGFGNPIAVGAMEVVPNMTSVANGAPYKPAGGRRRRRSRRRRGGADVDAPPVVGDIVADDGSKLFPEQQCVAEGRTWTVAPYGYTLTDAGNGLLGIGPEIAGPKNANGDPLGHCSGTKPPPNMGPTAPRAEDGGRRRRSRRKSKGRRRRSMRGGGSVAGVGYGFDGSGARGLANANPYPSNLPPSGAFAIPTGTR